MALTHVYLDTRRQPKLPNSYFLKHNNSSTPPPGYQQDCLGRGHDARQQLVRHTSCIVDTINTLQAASFPLSHPRLCQGPTEGGACTAKMGLQETVDSVANIFTTKKHGYSAIPEDGQTRNERLSADQRAQGRRFLKFAMLGVGVTILLMFTMSWG